MSATSSTTSQPPVLSRVSFYGVAYTIYRTLSELSIILIILRQGEHSSSDPRKFKYHSMTWRAHSIRPSEIQVSFLTWRALVI
jgi:hypothetical protein